MSYLCPHCNSLSPGRLRLVGLWEEEAIGGVRSVEKKYYWRAPNRLLVLQTGESVNHAKVFKAHPVPQGFCGNPINALKKKVVGEPAWHGKIQSTKAVTAHAVPQGLCGNLTNALKLLANQQEDGDGLMQNIVTNLGEGSRKGPHKWADRFHKDGQPSCL